MRQSGWFMRVIPLCCALALMLAPRTSWAIDSYRYLHVNLSSVWMIFVFLFFLVFLPMILMAVLYWWNAAKKARAEEEEGEG